MAKRGMSILARLGLFVLVILLVVGGALGAVAIWLPSSGFATRLQQTLSDGLGRPVTIASVHLTVWPIFGVEARDATIGNVAGGQAAHLVEAQAIDVGVAPIPLLSGRIEVRRLLLQSPRLRLERLKDGRVNWMLGKAQAGPQPASDWLKDLSIDRLEITQGQVSFYDEAVPPPGPRTRTLSDLNVVLTLRSLDRPLKAKGDFAWAGQTARFDIGVERPRALMTGQPTAATVDFVSAPLTLKLDGSVAADPGAVIATVEASGPSLRNLAKLAGSPMDPGPGLQAFSVKGHVVRQGQTVMIDHGAIGLDHLAATGDLTIDLAHTRPLVSGKVAMASLDLNPYLGPEPPLGAAWTTTPISLDGLRSFDADLAITAGQVAFRRYRLSRAMLAAKVTDGKADINISQMSLYGGSGTGRVIAAAQPGGGRYGFSFRLSGVQMKSLLMDAVKVDRLEGTAAVNLDLVASGANQDQIMHTLTGKANLSVANGAIIGVDLAAISKQITSALTGAAVGDNARTPFSVAGADFTLARGVATTTNLKLTGPGVAVGGVGTIDLGNQTLDMSIKPTGGVGVAGRQIDLGAVPFHVHGPWVKPAYEADLKGVAAEALRGQISKLAGGSGTSLDSLFGGLTGGTATPAATPAGSTAPAGTASPKSTPSPAAKKPSVSDLLQLIPH